MKILVLSLLRAGDLLMQRPLLAAIKARSENQELHVVLNDEVSWVAPILKEADHIHIFPRKTLQRLMGENNHHISRAPLVLSQFLKELNKNAFDEVINFTHNRLSAYLAEEIHALVKKGLHSEGPRLQGIENQWLKLFNDRFSGTAKFSFHYSEILARSFGLKIKPPNAPKKKEIKRIFLQALTSDSKKNWSLLSFRNLLDSFYTEYPSIEFKILSAEKEKLHLEKYFQKEEICTWDMETLEKELSSNDLLITGDTVTMHLAAQKSVQIIEIALGSSDAWKTGPYGNDHYVLTSKVPCYPCPHSGPCRQMSHLCSEPITPKIVAGLVKSLIYQEDALAVFSKTRSSAELFKTQIREYGYELISAQPEKDLRVLNKILWQKIFDSKTDISELRFINFGFNAEAIYDLQSELKEILHYLQSDFENMIEKLGLTQLNLSEVQESRRKMATIVASPGNTEWTWMFVDLAKLSFSSPLHFLSAYQDRLEILKSAIFYRHELIQEALNEPRLRTISEDSSVET